MLMFAYTELEYDGRVKRSFDELSKIKQSKIFVAKSSKQSNDIISAELNKLSLFYYAIFIIKSFLVLIKCRVFNSSVSNFYYHDYYSHPVALFSMLLFPSSNHIFDCHEIIFDNRLSIRIAIFKFFESWASKKYNVIVFPNNHRAKIFRRYYKIKFKSVVIRNITEFHPDKDTFTNLNRVDIVNVVYQGVISKGRGIDDIISRFKNVKGVNLTIIGWGQDESWLKDKVKNSNNIRFIGKVTREELQSEMKKNHIGIISYISKDLNNKFCAPNKIFEYVNSGLYVLSSQQPTIKDEVDLNNIGRTVNFKDHNDFIRGLGEVKEMLSSKSNLRKYVEENTWLSESSKYRSVLDDV
nr:glycosyltransferase [uncultured Vibrio sp.]